MSKEDSSLKVLEYLSESEVILDIGANIGQTALEINKNRLAKNKVYQIFCFEPFSENYLSLKKNIELNEPHSIIAENIGLGRTNANVNMFKDCISNSGGNRVVHTSSVNTAGIEEVAISSLDAYLNKSSINKIDFIKVDVEGYEFEVLSGALNTLKSQKPKLFIELDDKNLRSQGSSAKELLTFLEELNYSITDSNKQFSIAELKESSIHTDIYCE
jgi:FkbM family methyltransferase